MFPLFAAFVDFPYVEIIMGSTVALYNIFLHWYIDGEYYNTLVSKPDIELEE